MTVEVIFWLYRGIYLTFVLGKVILVYERKYLGFDLSQQGNLGKWKSLQQRWLWFSHPQISSRDVYPQHPYPSVLRLCPNVDLYPSLFSRHLLVHFLFENPFALSSKGAGFSACFISALTSSDCAAGWVFGGLPMSRLCWAGSWAANKIKDTP